MQPIGSSTVPGMPPARGAMALPSPVQVWAQVQTSKSTAEADINRATIE